MAASDHESCSKEPHGAVFIHLRKLALNLQRWRLLDRGVTCSAIKEPSDGLIPLPQDPATGETPSWKFSCGKNCDTR